MKKSEILNELYKNNSLEKMTLIHITFKTIPENKRYTILSNGKHSAVYKRIFPLIYWRVSRVYTEYEVWTEVVKEYERLTNIK